LIRSPHIADWIATLRRQDAGLSLGTGTSKVKHLEENVAAVDIQLSDEEYAALDREGRAESAAA
jgi:pyridoxine 4-dehydrogenase